MSTTADTRRAIAGCRPTAGTPVSIDADAIGSTAESYLKQVKHELDEEGLVPSEVVVQADFCADCSITTQAEADRVRDVIYAADYLGAGTVRLEIEGVADRGKVEPAIAALRERASREGLGFIVQSDTDEF